MDEAVATELLRPVRTYTVQRFGLAKEREYVSYNPPSNVGMKMPKGPSRSLALWRYDFACRSAGLAPIAGFARGCEDPVVLAEGERLRAA